MTDKNDTGDHRRLTTRALRARRGRLVGSLPDLEAILRGALLTQGRRCGKEGCRCQTGDPHGPYTYLAVRAGGRSRLIYVPAALIEPARRRLELGARAEEALAEIAAINLELLARRELR